MRRTKIVCTLGPSSDSLACVKELIRSGMNVARLNFSHGTHASHAQAFQTLRNAVAQTGENVAILIDLQGPRIRTGRLEGGGPVMLTDGSPLTLTTEDTSGAFARISTTYEGLPRDTKQGDRILIADGAIELVVEAVEPPEVRCRVIHGGPLGEHKGMNLPGVAVSAPSVTEKDRADLELGLELGADYVAVSFVRHPDDIRAVKDAIRAAGKDTRVVAKIERPEALERFEEIVGLADAVMVARGDLGVEVPLHQVPQIQKDLIRQCNRHGVPVITATQMLESMVTHPRPTRAEVTDVANAIYDGTDAVMLSGETATGKFPVRTVEIMAQIVEEADNALAGARHSRRTADWTHPAGSEDPRGWTYSRAIGQAAYHLSESLPIRRIVCFTSSGYTAAMIARYRPRVPITAFTLTEEARRRCALYWGVEAVKTVEVHAIELLVRLLEENLLKHRLVQHGDTVVIVAGTPLAVAGRTNLLRLHTIGDPL